jgi:hypothetical protein
MVPIRAAGGGRPPVRRARRSGRRPRTAPRPPRAGSR